MPHLKDIIIAEPNIIMKKIIESLSNVRPRIIELYKKNKVYHQDYLDTKDLLRRKPKKN